MVGYLLENVLLEAVVAKVSGILEAGRLVKKS